MSKRELRRVEVLARVRSKQLRLVDAGVLMCVSYRHAKRLWKRYREKGPAGLQHGNAGRRSNRAHEQAFRSKVLRLVRKRSEEHTSELQSRLHLVCRLLLEKKKNAKYDTYSFVASDTFTYTRAAHK